MHTKSFIRQLRLITVIIPFIALLGCFGDGSGPDSIAATSRPAVAGVFINSAVGGVSYRTSSGLSGLTDADGMYDYASGDTVTFSIGGIILGTTIAKGILTPVEVTGSVDPLDPEAINLMQILQSLDVDGIYAMASPLLQPLEMQQQA